MILIVRCDNDPIWCAPQPLSFQVGKSMEVWPCMHSCKFLEKRYASRVRGKRFPLQIHCRKNAMCWQGVEGMALQKIKEMSSLYPILIYHLCCRLLETSMDSSADSLTLNPLLKLSQLQMHEWNLKIICKARIMENKYSGQTKNAHSFCMQNFDKMLPLEQHAQRSKHSKFIWSMETGDQKLNTVRLDLTISLSAHPLWASYHGIHVSLPWHLMDQPKPNFTAWKTGWRSLLLKIQTSQLPLSMEKQVIISMFSQFDCSKKVWDLSPVYILSLSDGDFYLFPKRCTVFKQRNIQVKRILCLYVCWSILNLEF